MILVVSPKFMKLSINALSFAKFLEISIYHLLSHIACNRQDFSAAASQRCCGLSELLLTTGIDYHSCLPSAKRPSDCEPQTSRGAGHNTDLVLPAIGHDRVPPAGWAGPNA